MKYTSTTPEFERIIDTLPASFVAHLDKMLVESYLEGARDMKEKAIKACIKAARSESYYSDNVGDECAGEISKLEVKFNR
jgi:hypothetical protein